eukprot:CAMPEP_0206243590 /NCGR_PEP_ID=MMETSP0047_2-20121206/17687_1 /ASSEMBLY_ACC=CAM_ASM_000192 /TAXON_ID=195065 /ORGANISM="Chroomonas mesostigmatica_cf, Strain CCMP1168" /LENGTH=175 /DNA_ID=CAMNT_0053668717 /DNA_START=383 /DNA_END=907 /DNA_ORIENTATION=+
MQCGGGDGGDAASSVFRHMHPLWSRAWGTAARRLAPRVRALRCRVYLDDATQKRSTIVHATCLCPSPPGLHLPHHLLPAPPFDSLGPQALRPICLSASASLSACRSAAASLRSSLTTAASASGLTPDSRSSTQMARDCLSMPVLSRLDISKSTSSVSAASALRSAPSDILPAASS